MKITKRADHHSLVYARPLPAAGLTWRGLINWRRKARSDLHDATDVEVGRDLYRRTVRLARFRTQTYCLPRTAPSTADERIPSTGANPSGLSALRPLRCQVPPRASAARWNNDGNPSGHFGHDLWREASSGACSCGEQACKPGAVIGVRTHAAHLQEFENLQDRADPRRAPRGVSCRLNTRRHSSRTDMVLTQPP